MLTKVSPRAEISYPSVGAEVSILPTHVKNVNTFYAQIPAQNIDIGENIKEIILNMNSLEFSSKYVPLTNLPG